MRLLTISIGKPQPLKYGNRVVETGIYKMPVDGSVLIRTHGLEGDTQVDLKNHGGPDKAVYVYTLENYRFWEARNSVSPYLHGQFGENLTVEGMDDSQIHIGDVFTIGNAVMQVTQPRVPCFKLGLKFGDSHFVSEFMSSGRTGFYLRVLQEGYAQATDEIISTQTDPQRLCVSDAMKALQKGPEQRYWIEKVLSVNALSSAWREDMSRRLKKDT